MKARAIIVMGVSGSGKSTVGQALAKRLGWTFADADDHHLESNRAKLTRGEALTDADRQPWLERLHDLIAKHLYEHQPIVLACSALKATYRDILVGDLAGVQVVFLQGSKDVIAERMRQREHFMPVSLLESQLATLEPPHDALVLDIQDSIDVLVNRVATWLED